MSPSALNRALRALTLAAATTLATVAAPAAPIYLVDATTDGLAPDAGLANVAFSLTFEDLDLDQRFSLTELLAFTGLLDGNQNYFDTLKALPDLPGLAGSGDQWVFGDSQGGLADFSALATAYTPFFTGPLAGSVPEPAGAGLVAAALAAAALAGRRRPTPR